MYASILFTANRSSRQRAGEPMAGGLQMKPLDVELCDVAMSFGKQTVLSDVSLHIPAGKSVALLGKSGCGKTTLLRLIAGFSEPDKGRVLIGGMPPVAHRPERSIAFLFQEPVLWDRKRVVDAIRSEFELHEVRPSVGEIERILQDLDLQNAREKYPFQLSVGMRARLAIGQAFCVSPRLLLADEPFASLDPIRRLQLNITLRRLQHQSMSTSVWVTHDIVEALQFADTVVVLSGEPATIVATIKTSEFPKIIDPANLPRECLAVRDRILELLSDWKVFE